MAEDEANGSKEGAAANPHGASLRVDPRTLPTADQDFARLMGFGEEGQTPAPTPPSLPVAGVPMATEAEPQEELESASNDPIPEPAVETAQPEPAPEPTSDLAPDTDGEPAPAEAQSPARDWEEIHPRPATLGRQSILIERAERVLALPPISTSPLEREPASDPRPTRSAPVDDSHWLLQLRQRDARIAELEARPRSPEAAPAATGNAATTGSDPALVKELERTRNELDDLLLERDRMGDALAVANAARAEAVARAERLDAAYRAARGREGPVPEGERELRGEVIGLRRRLEESAAESRRLREALDASATDLAIARAQGDDRQQELDQQRSQIESLERDRASQLERLDESLARQRELLALVSRVQAENVELRSTQAALEETLEARDLEISAREEHLLVTRRGLAARDGQLIDAEERLEQERHRRELVESELERARLANTDLADRLTRRDARIATLSITLSRVEEAIGRGVPSPSALPEARMMPDPVLPTPIGVDDSGAAPAESSECAASTISPPPILARWRDAQIAAACGPEGARTLAEFLAQRLAAHAASIGRATLRVASLAGARVEAEIELLIAYRSLAAGTLEIRVVDRSPEATRARRQAIEAAGLAESISVEDWSSAERVFEPGAQALLLVDAVTSDRSAGALLDRMASVLAEDGIVLWADRLAGGPVVLSETTREKLAELWQVLPESWTSRSDFETPPEPGDDGGSPALVPDPLAALLERFRPTSTLGFGHVADLFLGPARGFELSQAGAAADSLLASVDAIDESRSILEALAPRHGVGVLVPRTSAGEADESASVEVIGLAWPEPAR